MSAPPIPQAVAHVVAWHNRHPLAQRITPAMVRGVGVVALPFVVERLAGAAPQVALEPVPVPAHEPAPEPALDATAEASPSASPARLRERALAVARGAPVAVPPGTLGDQATAGLAKPKPRPKCRAFSERFLAQPSLARIAVFARRHGALESPAAGFGPQRHVSIDPDLRGSVGTALVYLCTAAIEDGERRVRVLWGPAARSAVLGPRLWSHARMAVCGVAVSAGVLVAGLLPSWLHSSPAADVPTVAAHIVPASDPVRTFVAVAEPLPPPLPPLPPLQPTSPQSQPHLQPPLLVPPATALRASVQQPVAAAPPLHADLASEVEPAVVAAEPPPAIEGAVAWPVDIRPRINPTIRRSTQQHSASLRDTPRPTAGSVRAAKRGGAVGVYALVARSTKSRAASDLLLGFMQSAAAGQTQPSQHTEVLPDAKGWRASWWPFTSRQDAERALAALASHGLYAEIVEF